MYSLRVFSHLAQQLFSKMSAFPTNDGLFVHMGTAIALGCGQNKQTETTKKRWSWVTTEP